MGMMLSLRYFLAAGILGLSSVTGKLPTMVAFVCSEDKSDNRYECWKSWGEVLDTKANTELGYPFSFVCQNCQARAHNSPPRPKSEWESKPLAPGLDTKDFYNE